MNMDNENPIRDENTNNSKRNVGRSLTSSR